MTLRNNAVRFILLVFLSGNSGAFDSSLNRQLRDAAADGDSRSITALLKQGADPMAVSITALLTYRPMLCFPILF